MDKFHNDLQKLQGEIEQLRRAGRPEDSAVLVGLEQVRAKEEERIELAKDASKTYETMIQKFKNDISKEVSNHQTLIANEVEKKL